MIYERKYGTAATVATPLITFSLTSFHNSLTTTIFAAGDVKIAKDYGDFTNTATLPTVAASGNQVVLSLTATELQAAHIDIQFIDQTATKVWEDNQVMIETFANTTAAQFQFDRSSNTVQASLTAAQTGVTIATVTDITNAVNASITSTSVVASVTNAVNASITTTSVIATVSNTVQASLTAAQTGVTIATVTNVTNGVDITSTAVVNNLGASATAQINSEVDTALADIGLDHLVSAD